MDPFLAALGVNAAAGVGVEGGKALLRTLIEWGKGDEVTRLFHELDKRFGETPGISAIGLGPLRSESAFLSTLAAFSLTGKLDREAMVNAIEPHVGETEELTARQLAEQIADAIHLLMPRAKRSDRDAFLYAIEVMRQDIRPRREARYLSVDWAPPLARERVRKLIEEDEEGATSLEDALAQATDARRAIAGLINDPPAWLSGASHRTWSVLAEIAEGYGLWSAAVGAFVAASEGAGADRPGLLARAAVVAYLAEEKGRYDELLTRARALEADHAQVVLAELRGLPDSQARLERLSKITEPPDAGKAAALDVARALAHLELSEWDAAETYTDRVAERNPDHVALRELRPLIALYRNRERTGKGKRPDYKALRAAAEELLALRSDLLDSHRYEESGRLLARAIESYALADDLVRASQLLEEEIQEAERQEPEAAADLAFVALTAHRPDLVPRLLPGVLGDEQEELARAQAAVLGDDQDAVAAAVTVLDRLLQSDNEAVREQAALARQIAAIDSAVEENRTATQILEQSSPLLAVMLKAEKLARAGDFDHAEALLLPHHDDPRVLRTLIRWAGRRKQWERVIELSRPLLARELTPIDRLVYADALRRADHHDDALRELADVRQDELAPSDVRSDAYALSAQIVAHSGDFGTLEKLTRDWLALEPGHKEAGWRRLYALMRLSRPHEAVALIEQLSLDPETEEEGELMAAALERGVEPAEAARRIGEISDRFDRPEQLEAVFLLTGLRVKPDERVAQLSEQIRQRLEEFPGRYPESKLLRAIPVDFSHEEGIDAFFKEYVEPGAQHGRELHEQMREGTLPVAALAEAAGKPAAFVWRRLEGELPLGYGAAALDEVERAAAEEAIGRSVVWDPASLVIVTSLPPGVMRAIRSAFPASLVAQATLDDAARAANMPATERDEYMEIGYDPVAGQRWRMERTAADVAAERQALRSMLELARELEAVPDIDPSKPTDIDEFLRGPERKPAFDTWPASLALARREARPLYSDDRYIRMGARGAGVLSFGTVAALDALATRGLLSEADRLEARRLLRSRGARGIVTPVEELVAEASSAHWGMTLSLGFALLDPAVWNADAAEAMRRWCAFLENVFMTAPERLDEWVARLIDGAQRAIPGRSHSFFAQALLLLGWAPFAPERRPFRHALIKAVRNARDALGWYPDPLITAARRLDLLLESERPDTVRRLLARAFLQDIEFADHLRLLGIEIDPRWARIRAPERLDDSESARETKEILEDEETMAALRESDEDLVAGRVRPYEDVRQDLGVG